MNYGVCCNYVVKHKGCNSAYTGVIRHILPLSENIIAVNNNNNNNNVTSSIYDRTVKLT